MSKKFIIVTALLFLAVSLVGCSMIGIPSTGGPDLQATQNALIIQAAQATATQFALWTQVAQVQTQLAPQPTNTPEPVITTVTMQPQSPTDTASPADTVTATPLPPTATATQAPPTSTSTPIIVIPSVTPLPPTATPVPCNAAQFVSDVTVPDGSTFSPGSTFTKTWRLKNVGACTWTTSYDLVYVSGNQMSGPSAVDFPGSVAPGQVIDLSVTLVAPGNAGSYRGNWKLRDASGILFGLKGSDNPFYVDIKAVVPTSNYPYDFSANFCSAEWSSGAGKLVCPSPENDSRGFVLRYEKPQLESGYIDDEAALLTYPQMINDGIIRGKYPSYRVELGQHFKAIIGCTYKSNGCDVKFQLDYQIGDGSIQTLATWNEIYDELYNSVDVDLSSLAGKDVRFILTVFANGSSSSDRALWLAPRIEK